MAMRSDEIATAQGHRISHEFHNRIPLFSSFAAILKIGPRPLI
jgi:hypothetical protein